jgi:hypothetical protein
MKPVTGAESPSGYAVRSPDFAPATPQPTSPTCPCTTGMQVVVAQPSPSPSFWSRLTGRRPSGDQVLVPTPVAAPVRLIEPPPSPAPAPAGASAATPQQNWPTPHKVEPQQPAPANVSFQSRPLAHVRLPAASPTPAPVGPATEPAAGRVQPTSLPPAQTDPRREAGQPAHLATTVHLHPAPGAAAVTAPLKQADLRRIVQKACGKLASDIRVEARPNQQVLVHVVAAPASEQDLIAALLSIPEIAANNVKLEVHTSR